MEVGGATLRNVVIVLTVAEGLTHAETATKALFGDHHSLRSLTSEL